MGQEQGAECLSAGAAGVADGRMPPRACTWPSEVEVFHKLIEEELYELEDDGGRQEFVVSPIPTPCTSTARGPPTADVRHPASSSNRAAGQCLTTSTTSALRSSKFTSLPPSRVVTMYGHQAILNKDLLALRV